MYKLTLLFSIIGFTALGYKYATKPNITTLSSSFDESRYTSSKEIEYFPLSANCDNPQTGFLDFESEVYAHEEFVKFYNLDVMPKKLVEKQLKFIDGYLDHLEDKSYKFVPHKEKTFSILNIEKVSYPSDFIVDKIEVDNSLYPNFILGKHLKKNQEALRVSYKARVKVTKCAKSESNEKLTIILPKDPYLAFWYVPKNSRVLIIQDEAHKTITNPCSNKLMAELKYPNMYWNVWKPLAKESRFDCKELLNKDNHLEIVKSNFLPIKAKKKIVSYEYLRDTEVLKVSLISGFVSDDSPLELTNEAKKLVPFVNKLKDVKPVDFIKQDIGVRSTYTMIGLMNKISSDSKWSARTFEDYTIIKGSGKLLNSSKKYSMEIFIGATVDYQNGTKHWNFLADALNNSDFIFYSGHAGMGTAFTVPNIYKNTQLKNLKKSPQNQFIAVFSCSSISYFGDDFVKERNLYSKQTDFLLTGFDKHAYQLTPAVLQFIDLKLSGKDISFKNILESHLDKDSDIHLTRNIADSN